jgi:hypothetical protein
MIRIEVSELTAAALSAQAAAKGLSIEAYLANAHLSPAAKAAPRLSRAELDCLLDEEATSGPSVNGSFSREELYSDHD